MPYGARTRPRDPFADAQGRVWFVGQNGNYVARLDPKTGEFKRYEIEPAPIPTISSSTKGMVWFTGNRNEPPREARSRDGQAHEVHDARSTVRDPHTMIFDHSSGDAWFTAQNAGTVGKLRSRHR